MKSLEDIIEEVTKNQYGPMKKPYVTKLFASGCVPGTMIWFDHLGRNCYAVHPGYGQPSCNEAGWMEPVRSYHQWWGRNGYRGTRINGKLYMPGVQLQVVVGAGVKR